MAALYVYLFLGFICMYIGATEATPHDRIKRIYGGTDVPSSNRMPWKVQLKTYYYGDPYTIFMGVLITPSVVLTHANNVQKSWSSRFRVVAVVGENNTLVNESSEQVISVERIQKNLELALLYLSRDVIVNEAASPVPRLATPSDDRATMNNNDCYVVGWGRNSWGGDFRNLPHQFKVHVHSNTNCRYQLYLSRYSTGTVDRVITDYVVCASGDDAGICDGDGGAPLQCLIDGTWTLVGVTSWTINRYPCSDHYPDVYTRVSYFKSWIENNQ